QMKLIITLSSVLASTPLFRKAVIALSRIPKTANQVVALGVLMTAIASYLYWGLGIALGPIIAIYFAREAERKGVKIDFLFFLAVIWAANAVWQFGFSASAPLLVATPGHFMEKTIGVIPLSTTIWAPAAIIHEIVFTAAVIVVGCRLMPKEGVPVSHFPGADKLTEDVEAEKEEPLTESQRMERIQIFSLALCAMLAGGGLFYFFFQRKGPHNKYPHTELF